MAVELYDEHEQSERVRNWLKENGVSIFLGVALALAGIFGWRQWQDYRADRAVLANEYYAAIQQELGAQQVDAAAEQLDAMREGVGSHAYVAMAGMLVAAAWAEAGEIDKAASVYSELLEQGDWRSLEPLARIRLALLEAARGQGEAGLRLLAGEPVEEYRASGSRRAATSCSTWDNSKPPTKPTRRPSSSCAGPGATSGRPRSSSTRCVRPSARRSLPDAQIRARGSSGDADAADRLRTVR